MKLKIKSITSRDERQKKDGSGTFTITKFKGEDGKDYQTFDSVEEGKEYDGEAKENPPYAITFKITKEKKFPAKDYTFEKKRVALECTTSLIVAGVITDSQFDSMRDKLFNYLNS